MVLPILTQPNSAPAPRQAATMFGGSAFGESVLPGCESARTALSPVDRHQETHRGTCQRKESQAYEGQSKIHHYGPVGCVKGASSYSRRRTTPLQAQGASARVRLTHPTP